MIFFLIVAGLSACGGGNSGGVAKTEYLPVSLAAVEDPPAIGSPFLLTALNFSLDGKGYRQREYFLSGSATAFSNSNELHPDGRWQIEPAATADYKTRVLICLPADPTFFSGTVFVEWLNVSAGFETNPTFSAGHTEILRSGHAWVGVSAQIVGIEGAPNALLPFYLKAADPERYASLSHPGDSFSYDIFSQVARALRETAEFNLLPGLTHRRLIALGQSQAASRMLTYINAIHPLYAPYDGYLVQSRYLSSAPLSQPPQAAVRAPEVVQFRDDLNVPVLNLQTETDLIGLGSITSRQSDSRLFRLWETAGTSHSDYYVNVSGRDDTGEDPSFALVVEETSVAGFINCDAPMNAGPLPWLVNASLSAIHNWVLNGASPAKAARLATSDDNTQLRRNDQGNARGGVRTPHLEAPAARLSGDVNEGETFCNLFGTTTLFDAATMASRYVDKAGYITAVSETTDKAVGQGFLLASDGERIKAAAELQWDLLDLN